MEEVFGPYTYSVGCVEFQKRGLLHAHICVRFQIDGPDNELDEWVWPQLPSPDIAGGLLRERVLKYMIHRPCGGHNANSPCMETNNQTGKKRCNKYYPQPWRTTATTNDISGRIEYKRIDNGDRPTIRQFVENKWCDVPISNQWVVPYSPYLLLKYNAHVMVDAVSQTVLLYQVPVQVH